MEKKKAITMATKLYAYFEERIKEKRLAKKENTADMYRAATNWLKKYMKEKELLLGMVTQQFVADYEAYLKTKNLKPNSVNAYLSNFRAMYNSAARECKRKINENPFANVKIKPHETVKRALPHETMEKIAGLKLKDKPELEQAADLSMFCFRKSCPKVNIRCLFGAMILLKPVCREKIHMKPLCCRFIHRVILFIR